MQWCGAKGVVYPGAYQALIDTGVYSQATQFSGASAGAMTAALMASGMSGSNFRDALLHLDFKALLGNKVRSSGEGVSLLTKDGKPLLEFMRAQIHSSIKTTIETHQLVKHCKDSETLKLIQKVFTKPAQECSISFKDLALLNQKFPLHFKQLVVTAVGFPSGNLQLFNSTKTPKVEIALACRASASLPILLEPVKINISGTTSLFVDGGLYDNIPDYFDSKVDGVGSNTQPTQTLVFAFGEGLNDKKNQVFQALYGQRLDEAIADELIEHIMQEAIKLAQKVEKQSDDEDNEVALLTHAVKTILSKYTVDKTLNTDTADFIDQSIERSIQKLLKQPEKYRSFWNQYSQAGDDSERIKHIGHFIKEQMKPILYKADFIEQIKRDTLVKYLGGFKAPYLNTHQKELGYQKIRTDYPLRTVELRTGTIKTTQFDLAPELARTMDALGYLDTVNHITNYDLHDPEQFNSEQFYIDLVDKFTAIYKAVLAGSGKNPNADPLWLQMHSLRKDLSDKGKEEPIIARQLYQLVKSKVDQQVNAPEAFALSRSVEYHNNTITAEALFKEVYEEGFRRSPLFSVSSSTGKRIMQSSTLHQELKDKNMFEVYTNRPSKVENGRTEKVFSELNALNSFKNKYESFVNAASKQEVDPSTTQTGNHK